MKQRTYRLQIMITDEERRAIDEWRFENRLPTRAAALRELMRRGMMVASQNEKDTFSERRLKREKG